MGKQIDKQEPGHFTKCGTRKYQTNGPQEWTAGLLEIADMVGSPHMGVAINIVMDWAMERLEDVKADVEHRLAADRRYAEQQREAGPGSKKKGKEKPAEAPAEAPKQKRQRRAVRGPQMVMEEVPEAGL